MHGYSCVRTFLHVQFDRCMMFDTYLLHFLFVVLLIVLLVAGHDTSSSALQWLFYELAKQPHIQDKILEDVNQVLGLTTTSSTTTIITYDDTRQMNYLRMVIQENLRLHPPVHGIFKYALEDLELVPGVTIPKGTNIGIDIYCKFRCTQLFEQACFFLQQLLL